MSEHRAHPTKYKITVSRHGSSRPLRTWGPYESRETAIEALDEMREKARREGRLAPPYGKAGGDLVFSLLQPTETWGAAGPLRRDLSRPKTTTRRTVRKTSSAARSRDPRKFKTQAEINKAIGEYEARGIRAEERRDRAPFESAEYWKHHDIAVKWFTKAEALMPGGSRWAEKARREGRHVSRPRVRL